MPMPKYYGYHYAFENWKMEVIPNVVKSTESDSRSNAMYSLQIPEKWEMLHLNSV
jgi:hypothetical protein